MAQDRKRQIRLVVALSVAVLLAVALIYTSFSAASDAREPSQVLAAGPSSNSIQVTGKVVSERDEAGGLRFEMVDRDGSGEPLSVAYEGIVPDPFREGREVIVTGVLGADGVFAADKDSLITKCPSKFSAEAEKYPDNVLIEP